MNAYVDLTTIKDSKYFNISGSDEDTDLRGWVEAASRMIDKELRRYFYVKSETRYENGSIGILFLSEDLLDITKFKTDEDADATFEAVFIAADYILYPLNGYPKTHVRIAPDSNYSYFAAGVHKGVEIAGLWGCADSATPYVDSGATLTVADGTSTSVTASDGTKFAICQTVLCELEQMYITNIVTNTLTVRRAVNGTTGVAHSAKAGYIYEYPPTIVRACLITAMRLYKRKDSSYMDILGNFDTGQIPIVKGLDPDVTQLISGYKKTVGRFA